MSARRTLASIVLAAAVGGGAAGCAGFRAELNGRDVGRNVCDVKTASNADQAQRAVSRLQRELDQAQRIVGRPVQKDVTDIDKNIADLANHVDDQQSALARQDVAAIRRNVQSVVANAPQLTKQFYEGVVEGLGDCV